MCRKSPPEGVRPCSAHLRLPSSNSPPECRERRAGRLRAGDRGRDAIPSDPVGAFALGVASGDPRPDGFVLWTRLAPTPLAADGHGGMRADHVPVQYEVTEDSLF